MCRTCSNLRIPYSKASVLNPVMMSDKFSYLRFAGHIVKNK